MPFDIGSTATQAAGDIVGAGLGIALGQHDDQRQVAQQHRLTDIQLEAQKNMGDYNLQNQLKLWDATNYSAQMKQLEKAGLNPGLIYGMGGGGGQTAQAQPGHVEAGSAQQNPGETQAMAGLGIQTGMQAAQIELMKAQARNLDADTANKPKAGENITADTTKKGAETQSITQGIENQKAQEALTNAQTKILGIQTELASGTLDNAITKFAADTKTAIAEATQAMNNAKISEATVQDKIKILKQEAIGKALDNVLKRTDLNLKAEQIKAIKESVINMNSLRQMKWNEEERGALHQQLKSQGIDDDTIGGAVDKIINGIISLF